MWGSQTTTGFTCFRMQGVPGDCRRLAPKKTFLLSCEIDLGRQVDVPAACDIAYSTSCALLSSLCTGVLAEILESEARSQVQGVPWIRSFLLHRQQGNQSLLKTLRHIFLLMPQQSLELIAEFISLMRTHHQGSLGVQVCVRVCVDVCVCVCLFHHVSAEDARSSEASPLQSGPCSLACRKLKI